VRKAIAIAVDYPTIIANAMTNQSATFDQVPRSLMNPTPGEQALYDHEAVKRTCSGPATTSKAPRNCSMMPASSTPMATAGANTMARSWLYRHLPQWLVRLAGCD
jgi:hypothetical protein